MPPILAYVAEVFTRPFRPAPLDIARQSLAARNRERRRVITRLFTLFTGMIVLLVGLPVAFAQAHSFTTAAILLLIAGLGFGGVFLTERGLATVPAGIFALGGIAGATVFAITVGSITVSRF